MATNFPSSLDALTNPIGSDTLASPDHAGQHADSNDAIEALQAKVGVDSSAVVTSLDYKVAQKIDKTLVDAKGDLIVASAADTVGRLAVGATNGHVLTVDSTESLGVKWAAVAGGSGMTELDAQTFTSSTTYTVVAGAQLILVELISSGGGAGGGSRSTGTSLAAGGGGGAGGPYLRKMLTASEVGGAGASVTVTIGAGGAGGAGRTGSTGSGTDGSRGGVSRFGTIYMPGGRPGTAFATFQTKSYSSAEIILPSTRGFGMAPVNNAGASGALGGAGGGQGRTSNGATALPGFAGGKYYSNLDDALDNTLATGEWLPKFGGGGTAGTANGGAGGNAALAGDGGGGGGGSTNGGAGGIGGNGATPGGGGGGGGGANADGNGGDGGNGGDAQIKIWVFG